MLAPARRPDGLAGHLWEQTVLPRLVGPGSLWSPANTGPLAVDRQAVTIYDLAPLDHPEWFRPLFAAWYRWLWPRLVRRVHTVLTISDFSRARIVHGLGLPEDKVAVVPAGIDLDRFRPAGRSEIEAVRAKYELSNPFVLFVGTIQPRKNLSGLAQALRALREHFPGLELAAAGDRGEVFAPDRTARSPGVRFLGRVPDDDLPALYSAAAVFAQPSFYEGGGLTVLEALACGCPAAAARGSGLEEYLGDAGVTFDPQDSADIAAALGGLLADESLRRASRAAGLERVHEYSWRRTAALVKAALEAIPPPASPG
jgi:glycosyltransferase involved in cell wall biosynthesis